MPKHTDPYALVLSDGTTYRDKSTGKSFWDWDIAKMIARNISLKRSVTVRLIPVEDVITEDSTFDRIIAYVDTLKGKHLSVELARMNLPIGSDPVASKRQRLISHFTKHGYNPRQGK